jgi:carboxymethylenebutenolidase
MIRQGAQAGFRAALAFYPGCGPAALLEPTISTTSPVAMFLAENDEEVSPASCLRAADRSRAAGTSIEVTVYPGATHDFDDPGKRRQSVAANQAAKADAMAKAAASLEEAARSSQ